MNDLAPYLVSGLGAGIIYALSGMGLVVLYRASGVLNFSFGAVGALGAYCAWSLIEREYPLPVAWLAAVAVATLLSFGYGRFIGPLLAHRDRVVRSVGTLGFALVVMGFTEWYWGESPRRLSLPTDFEAIEFGEVRFTYTRLLSLGIALAMMAGVGWLLQKTRIGLYMRSLADNRHLSSLLGIRVIRVDAVAWSIAGAFAGICGILLANMVRLQATFLTFLVIPAFAAAILGRLGSLPATIAGGIAIGIIEALMTTVPAAAAYRSATPFLIAILAMAVLGRSLRTATGD